VSAPDLSPPASGARQAPRTGRLTGSAALRLHLTLALGLAASAAAFVIEVFRALGGNTLSWVYVVEWPMLAAFGTYMWWSLFTGRDRRTPPGSSRPSAEVVPDEKLEAWTRYVRELEEADGEAGNRSL